MTRSLGGRIVLGSVIIHILLAPFLFMWAEKLENDAVIAMFVHHAKSDALLYSEALSEKISLSEIEALLSSATSMARARYAEVVTSQGAVRSNPYQIQFRKDFFFGQHEDNVYFIETAFNFNEETATLRLGYDEITTQALINKINQNIIYFILVYISLFVILAAIVSRQLTRPLRALQDAARRIADGDSSQKITAHSGITLLTQLAEDLEAMRTALVSQAKSLSNREEHLRTLMNNVADGIITVDNNGQIISTNYAAENIFGYKSQALTQQEINILLDMFQPLSSPEPSASSNRPYETVGHRENGETFPAEVSISEMRRGDEHLYIAIVRDISARKKAEAELKLLHEDLEKRVIQRTRELDAVNKELEFRALHDTLTALPNRTLLQDRLKQAILTASRTNRRLALMFVDLDRFKEINDTLGHHYGDVILKEVALRMQDALRESDTIARLGGDEFAIVLPSLDGAVSAETTAAKITEALSQSIVIDEHQLSVSASIGIAYYPEHGQDPNALMRHADIAMYSAKRTHSNYTLYNSDLDKSSITHLTLASELQAALAQHQIVVHYQPIVDLISATVAGIEALARWQHPRRGLILPEDFISMAEHVGLIKPLTFYILDQVCAQLKKWHDIGLDINVAINLSARLLNSPHLAEQVVMVLNKWKIAPHCLTLEITENALITSPKQALAILSDLNAKGLALAIDDFGTGYSSLSHLKQLPVNKIKIDKSFIIDIQHNNGDMAIVRSTIDLAHHMGRQVIAEGIESTDTLNLLFNLGCDMAQGYHISKPIPADGFPTWLRTSGWRLEHAIPQSAQER